MNPPRWLLPALILGISATQGLRAKDDSFAAPDSLILKDGRTVHGLIIRNTFNAVVLQEKSGEITYPKKDIVRIRDESNSRAMYTGVTRRGDLPAWRVIANDLRTHDEIKSLVEIPATAVDSGVFKNVPYMSFRANHDIELDIYGDPEDPAGFEMGIFGARAGDDKLRKVIRGFIAGFLSTREEIAALYSLSFKGGLKTAGNVTIEITPKNAPDAYGAWWISLYNVKALNKARVSNTAYLKITRPVKEVLDDHGRVLASVLLSKQLTLTEKVQFVGDTARALLQGFYRDKNGNFRLVAQEPQPMPVKSN